LVAGLVAQFNGQDAPLIQSVTGQTFDVARFKIAA
jgi:hypothetical protein